MSQFFTAVSGTVPTNVPINFVTNAGTAMSSANTIKIFGAGSTSTSGAGDTVTITTSANVVPWTDEAINFTAVVNNGYFCTAALTASLPAAPTQGQIVIIEADTAGAITVTASAGKFLRIGSQLSLAAGSAVSSRQGDSIYLVYRAASLTWQSISTEGTWSVT